MRFLLMATAVFSFAGGVLVRDVRQDWLDKARSEAIAAQVRSCPHYVVIRHDGSTDCRALMPILILDYPFKRTKR